MINIFPKAERAIIEETIGYRLPTAMSPANQIPKPPHSYVISDQFTPYNSVPSWFDDEKISQYEANIFTNDDYLRIRNSILYEYSISKGYMTVYSCVGLGDFPTVLKVFNFLEDSKLINYQIDLKMALINLSEGGAANEKSEFGNIRKSRSDSILNNVSSHYTEKKQFPKVKKRYVSREFLTKSRCDCCEKAEFFTSDLYFICNKCFESGNYPENLLPRNFHRITNQLLRALWTKHEEYMLLRNIEIHGDDWKKVSENINKTTEQCIFHFLKMSLIDECRAFPSLSFSSVPNSISTLIAYISYIVHPSISAELAKNALKYIDRKNILEILISLAAAKASEVLDLEKMKKKRLEKLGLEAEIIKIKLKADAIKEMYNEVKMVKNELENAREKLIDELSKK